jgi:hypothetical protein
MAKRGGSSGNVVTHTIRFLASLAKLLAIVALAIGLAGWRVVAGLFGLLRPKSQDVQDHTSDRPTIDVKVSLSGQDRKRSKRPPPPALAEYVAAGVDPNACTLCRKPVPGRPREWKFCGMDGAPFVIFPACWNKRYVYADSDESTKFMDRMTTYYSHDKPT